MDAGADHNPGVHMRAEIAEQPAALHATIESLLPCTARLTNLASETRQVLFFGRGTSDNAAVYGSYLIQTRTGRLASLGSPSVATTYRSKIDLSGVMRSACPSPGGPTRSSRRWNGHVTAAPASS